MKRLVVGQLTLMMTDITEGELTALEVALPNTVINAASGGGSRLPERLRATQPAP